jgi:hypothetical protein
MNIDKSLGIEVFVVAEDEGNYGEIDIHDDFITMQEYLSLLNPDEHNTTKAYHGILMPAHILPPDLKGIRCFILALEMRYRGHVPYLNGYIYESDCEGDVDMLATDVEQVVRNNEFTAAMRVTIDDVFVLYGHELEVCLAINPDSVDGDGVVEKAKNVAKVIKAIETHEKERENAS